MSEFLFSAYGFPGSGPLVILREFVQWLVKVAGPVVDVLRPLWVRLVAFLGQLYEELSSQYEQEQDRARWGRPEIGWAE